MPLTDRERPPTDVERTFSLEDAATIICGDTTPADLDWLVQRLRGTKEPRLSGYKVGRRWRMTESDVTAAIELLRPNTLTPTLTTMTPRSRRRMAVAP